MDKKKIGNFIKELRKEKKLSQEDLADLFLDVNIIVSCKAISDWENGKTIPEIEKIRELANIFEITIDELLDGERISQIDLKKEYFICNKNWYIDYPQNKLYQMNQEQVVKIKNKFNELLNIRINNEFTISEEKEFKFLFNNFYQLSDYCINQYKINVNDNYLLFKYGINNILNDNKDLSNEDKIWEIRKLIVPNDEITFNRYNLIDFKNNIYLKKAFNNLEFWEKDMVLSSFQKFDFNNHDYSKYGSENLKRHENEIGEDYDKEKEEKEIIKFLINNGACINKNYLNSVERIKIQKRIIDKLEEIYNRCFKPLSARVFIDNVLKDITVENTKKNRFIIKYYEKLYFVLNYSIDELYDLVVNNEEIPNNIIIEIAKIYNINTNQDMKYILSDLNVKGNFDYFEKIFKEYKKEEKEIENDLCEINFLLEKIKNNEKYYYCFDDEEVGVKTTNEIYGWYYCWNCDVSKKEIYKLRMVDETKELLKNIDNLSLKEIRDKYFKMEVYENE